MRFLDVWTKLNETYIERSADVAGYKITIEDSDVDLAYNSRESTAWVTFNIKKDNKEVNLYIAADYVFTVRDDLDIEWTPDDPPTYVPYGSQSVLLDDGKNNTIDDIHFRAVPDIKFGRIAENGYFLELTPANQVPVETVKAELNINDEQLNQIIDIVKKLAKAEIKDKILYYISDNPDRYVDMTQDEPDWEEF